MSQKLPFQGPRLKVAHALKEIERLSAELAAYNGFLVPEISGQDVSWVMHIQSETPEIETVAGTIIYSLRSSLDLTAVWLVKMNHPDTIAFSKGVQFPFANSEANLETIIKEKRFHRASTAAQDLLRTMRPYTGGNKLLRGLHDLNLRDKHNDLIEVNTLAGYQGTIDAGFVRFGDIAGTPRDGQSVMIVRGFAGVIDPQPRKLYLSANIASEQPFAGDGLIATLRDLEMTVRKTVEDFAALYHC